MAPPSNDDSLCMHDEIESTSSAAEMAVRSASASASVSPESDEPHRTLNSHAAANIESYPLEEHATLDLPVENNESEVLEAESRLLDASGEVAATAYTVEEHPELVSAAVVNTFLGAERKRLVALCMGVFLVMFIVLAIVLGILIPKANSNDDARVTQNVVCGPLCGADNSPVPNPDRVILGLSCSDWDTNSRTLPLSSGSESIDECSAKYSAAAFGCGCANAEVSANNACGKLCADGSDLPNPDMMVKDITNTEMSCADWELKAKFDTYSKECVNYNVIGIMCGCKNNEPHPDACGPLCTKGDSPIRQDLQVYGTFCKNWNIMSTSLPKWYHNEAGDECSDYYRDIAYGCGCPGIETPPDSCNAVCKERRVCGQICQDGSSIPDPNSMTRDNYCLQWEYHSRMESISEVCPYYEMVGSECGCNNSPPEDACGPLCGPENIALPDPDLVVQGLTCSEWDSMSSFLSESYGSGDGDVFQHFDSCDEFFSKISYGCGCPNTVPPSNSCGRLCADGSPLPDPSLVVGDRTCGDLELLSLFETNPRNCFSYQLFGYQCGCDEANQSYDADCVETESLMNRTFSYTIGSSQYYLSFGEDGIFAQLQMNYGMNVIGRYSGFGTGSAAGVATFRDGAPCGRYGPRRGSVNIVPDQSIQRPVISYVIESTNCYYEAELRVPNLCNVNSTDGNVLF